MKPASDLAIRSLPAIVLGTALAAVVVAPALHVPGHRGGLRLADGFRPGRWDARFVVARAPAVLVFPSAPVNATVLLSGPALVDLGGATAHRRVTLGAMPTPVRVVLPSGGSVSVAADRTVRLHSASLVRAGPPPWSLALLALAAGVAGAGVAVVLRSGWGLALSAVLAASVGLAAASWDEFATLALAVLADRLAPAAAVLVLTAAFVPALVGPRVAFTRGRPSTATPEAPGPGSGAFEVEWRLPGLFGAATLVSCLAQVLMLPQPLIIGDPAAYHEIGGRFRDALSAVRGPDGLADALHTLRPYGGLFATGLVYGAVRGLHDGLPTIYLVHAAAMAGAVRFLVSAAHRLGGRRLAVLAGAAAVLYPTFPVISGIVQPEPFILLAWTWSLDRFLAAREHPDPRKALAHAGLGFGAGLALHPQGMWFLLAALGLVLVPWARRLSQPAARRRAGAFALGLMPVALAIAAGEAWSRTAVHVLDERHGFWAYTVPFPLGFWLFLDTDGWQGPERIADTRYARGLAREEKAGASQGVVGRGLYTVRFVAENAGASLRTVFRNAHRLFHVPDNPFRRDWILPYGAQLRSHRVLVVLFLLAAPLMATRAPVLLVPFAILLATYPLYHVFNKYAVPATPFVILGASLGLSRLASDRHAGLIAALAAAGLGAWLTPADLALRGCPPSAARVMVAALHWGGLATAFVLAGRRWANGAWGRAAAAAGGLVALVPALAAAWGDPSWREYSVALADGASHEVVVGAEALDRLDAAREAFVLLDLHVPDGDPAELRVEFEGGAVVEGRDLRPMMPRFGLATYRGNRDPPTFRQWWGIPWRTGFGRDGRVAVVLRGGPRGARLHGDLDDRASTALSFGQPPYLSVYRLMHDGEYRLAAPRALAGTRASRAGGRALPGTLGVHLLVLDEDAGGAVWETDRASAHTVVTGIWARLSRATSAELATPGGTFRVDLPAPAVSLGTSGEMRFLPTGDHEGWFVLKVAATRGEPVRLSVRPFLGAMSLPRFFLPELRSEPPPLPLDWGGYPYAPARRILEERPAPPWRPVEAY